MGARRCGCCGGVVEVRGVQVWRSVAGEKPDPGEEIPSLGRPSLSQAGGQHPSPRGCFVGTPRRLGAQAVEVQGGHKGPQAAHHSVPGPPPRAHPERGAQSHPARGAHSKSGHQGLGGPPRGRGESSLSQKQASLGAANCGSPGQLRRGLPKGPQEGKRVPGLSPRQTITHRSL